MTTIVFFNNKGGVGKTSLTYHLAWMFADRGVRVLAADFDPQANLTSMFLEEDRLEELWPEGEHPLSILGTIRPILRGTGDIAVPHVEEVADNIGVVVGDLGLSLFEDKLSDAWPRCLDGDESAFRIISAFHRVLLQAAQAQEAELCCLILARIWAPSIGRFSPLRNMSSCRWCPICFPCRGCATWARRCGAGGKNGRNG